MQSPSRLAMGDVIRKIEEIEYEMSKTQKNKATAGHLGMLKAKLAKLRRELITPKSQGGSAAQVFICLIFIFIILIYLFPGELRGGEDW